MRVLAMTTLLAASMLLAGCGGLDNITSATQTIPPLTIVTTRDICRAATSRCVTVPDVVGKSSTAAVTAIDTADLAPSVAACTAPSGHRPQTGVISQSPAAGVRSRRGSVVTLYVAGASENPNAPTCPLPKPAG